jgi:hypothetical protein
METRVFELRNCDFDNGQKDKPEVITIELNDDQITIDFGAIINTQFSGGNVPDKYEYLRQFLRLGEFSSAPGGGFVNFYAVTSSENVEYILFSGIREVYNSHYIVTVYKVLQF